MKKSKNVAGKAQKNFSNSSVSQRKNCGYRPTGSRTSEGIATPDCSTGVQNKKCK